MPSPECLTRPRRGRRRYSVRHRQRAPARSSVGAAVLSAVPVLQAVHVIPGIAVRIGARTASAPGTPAEQAFINQVAAGAIAAQKAYGVPASVTIAQAIDESAWGQSTLAAQDHNLFGIKGTGPAGSVSFPTQEFQNGQWVTISAQFRAYDDVTQSIADHGKLLATSGYYTAAMAASSAPDNSLRRSPASTRRIRATART